MTRPQGLLAAALFLIVSIAGSGPASAQGVQLFAVLIGGNEIDAATGKAKAGDPNGYGSAAVIFGAPGTLCYALLVNNIDQPVAAHIHPGTAGTTTIVKSVTFTNLPSAPGAGTPGASSGCVTGVAASLLNSIRSTPSNYYINVHTHSFPNGAIRGQLF